MADTKYIFVTGGVVSSLGKGIIAASLAKLIQARGLRVTIQKFDPYINIDPGTLNPYEHGECYVTKDGHEADLDLVEVAPNAKPPVAKIMDFGKFKYEQAQKARESRKNQQQTVVKEQKFRPKIDDHDYETKKANVVRFLEKGSKVKVTIMFRGREQSRPELGYRLLERLANDVEEFGIVESRPKQDGRNMTMVIGPIRKGKK